MNYTKYNPVSGEIISVLSITDQNSVEGNLINSAYIEGYTNPETHYIDVVTKAPVEKPAKPSDNHTWDPASKSWFIDTNQLELQVRIQRNQLLSNVDRVNPVWYNSLTQEQQTELQQYRQQLLDVPQQASFPVDIAWPTKPSWL